MPITHSDIATDEDRARRVLSYVRSIAPCVLNLDPSSEEGKDAIAILKSALAELPETGSRRTRSLSRNGTSMSFDAGGDFFTDGEVASLRALCEEGNTGSPSARGTFPKDRPISKIWPETYS